ncbi:UNVERIFIED_CONTAM: hypothetical protein RMT77_004884 [Armadillidium vulgare]
MVDLSGGGPDGPIEHGFSNTVFIIAAAILLPIFGFFIYRLSNNFLHQDKKREDKRKIKLEKHRKKR